MEDCSERDCEWLLTLQLVDQLISGRRDDTQPLGKLLHDQNIET